MLNYGVSRWTAVFPDTPFDSLLMKHKLLLLISALLLTCNAGAQCPVENTAFKSGEHLDYDLYFNWKFIWIKVGSAQMDIKQTKYKGQDAYRAYLITRGSKQADRYFVMRDTLTSYVTTDIVPLFYQKAAYEGNTYRNEIVHYNYENGKARLNLSYQKNDKPATKKTVTVNECPYDMISMLLKARSFDGSKFKVGDRISFMMAEGKHCERQYIVYRGREKFTNEYTDETFDCLVFSFVEKKGKKEKDIVTFYVTNDKNHLPVRLDLNLKFGSAKAFLKTAKGVRHKYICVH